MDLGETIKVGNVVIVPQADPKHTNNYKVLVGDNRDHKLNEQCGGNTNYSGAATVYCSKNGRFVTIESNDFGKFILCEVEVYAK